MPSAGYSSIDQDENKETPALRNEESTLSASEQNTTSERAHQCYEISLRILACIVVIGGHLNFMVFLVLWVADYELHKNITGIWNKTQCNILIGTCSCTCCMLSPLVKCHCPWDRMQKSYTGRYYKDCRNYCPMFDADPPLDASCNVPGRTVQTQDSFWGPGQPSCFLKYHRSATVEYNVSSHQRQVTEVYEVCVGYKH
jgi:hypothetical protein